MCKSLLVSTHDFWKTDARSGVRHNETPRVRIMFVRNFSSGPPGMVAKIASDEKKPDGQTRIQPTREAPLGSAGGWSVDVEVISHVEVTFTAGEGCPVVLGHPGHRGCGVLGLSPTSGDATRRSRRNTDASAVCIKMITNFITTIVATRQ